ncbi:MAG TPA: DUF2188 domain-containing protein [Ignavibacteriaceae bacterium]|nr:DUF2188 domain-containing protein [Ignavibacteriaceae bacterium]
MLCQWTGKWIVKRESPDEILASHYRKDKAIESAKEIFLGRAELIILKERWYN